MSPFLRYLSCQLTLAIIWFPHLLYGFQNHPTIQRQRISKDVSSPTTDTDDVVSQRILGGVDLSTILQNSDKYKESSRVYRRTVFKENDWAEFRASDRLFKNLKTMFISGTVRGLLAEVGSVLVVSTIVWIINYIILSGLLEEFGISRQVSSLVSLPVLPFQLSSPALGLLLVFRTNTGTFSFHSFFLSTILPCQPLFTFPYTIIKGHLLNLLFLVLLFVFHIYLDTLIR